MIDALNTWLDSFFDDYYRRRPVNATFIGVHQFDDRLPDLSEAGQAALASSAGRLLADLRALPEAELSIAEQIDRELAQAFLELQQWEAASRHFGWGNPSLCTGEAVFGVLSLLLRPFAPLTERLDRAADRLNATPRLLQDAETGLHDAPLAWCERARRECAGAALLLSDGLDQLVHESGVERPDLHAAAARARDGFTRFDAFIENRLIPTATDSYACGTEVFDRLLRRAHFLETDAAELERMALERMAEEAAAPKNVPSHGANVPSRAPLVPSHGENVPSHEAGAAPDADLDRYAQLWQQARALAQSADVLTFPDWPVTYRHQPAWVRESAPYFYFLPYRSPAPFDAAQTVEYFVPKTADDSTIKLNHVIHHGSWGHHVQNWHAMRAPSRIGQIAAVDCASRIAMLCGGTLAEGWACYVTDLADEAGFLTPAESAGQPTARIRMAARAVVDIRLHEGRMSLDEAANFYIERVGMTAGASRAEAIKNSLFPGAACMYFAGWDGISQLRREFIGRGMSLREFHDRLLGFGSIPVTLAGRVLRAALETEQYHQPRYGHATRARGT